MKFGIGFLLFCASAHAALPGPAAQLEVLRRESTRIEEALTQSVRDQGEVRSNLRRIREMQRLHGEQKKLAARRIKELEVALEGLEGRRVLLNERIAIHQEGVRRRLGELFVIDSGLGAAGVDRNAAQVELARKAVLEAMSGESLREIEAFRVDLADADLLEDQIQKEKQQLIYLSQDLMERESVMELSKQLQADLLSRRKADRASQLERYRELKRAELEVERMIEGFNARIELERVVEQEKKAEKAMAAHAFPRLKGTLSLPAQGRIIGEFGRAFDNRSGLHVFRKGIEIEAGRASIVSAIAAGKVAYAGEMNGYGKIVIVDHGDNYYTLSGRLSSLKTKTGDFVTAGSAVGASSDTGESLYFEIRSRNIPVNPLLWVSR